MDYAEVERALARDGHRGHVYLPAGGPPVVSTARIGPNRKSELIGPAPTRTAIRAAAGSVDGLLGADAQRRASVAPVLWNTVHLVVTDVTPAHALLVALHHADEYPAEDLEELRTAAAGDAAALETAFTETTGRTLPPAAQPWLAPRRNGQRPPAAEEAGGEKTPHGRTMITHMAEALGAHPEESSNLRVVMRGIARSWPTLDAAQRERTLRIPPRLTGTTWDALLAAVTEHVAWLNGHPKPAWVDEPARFNERPRSYTPVRRQDAWCWAPGAFLRHGALADPRDLDARGGERHDWIPRP